ncbi:MAG: peptide deformylase [Pseudomonadota bacterium]
MSVRPILLWPDPRLAQPCAAAWGSEGLSTLIEDLLETIYAAPGYAAPGRGNAAPQIGAMRWVFVMAVGWRMGAPSPIGLIDPKITWANAERAVAAEGCLSIPGVTAEVARPVRVRIVGRNREGEAVDLALSDAAARCAQHEIDHLDGQRTFDRLAAAPRAALAAVYAASRTAS